MNISLAAGAAALVGLTTPVLAETIVFNGSLTSTALPPSDEFPIPIPRARIEIDRYELRVLTAGTVTIDVDANDIDFGRGASELDSQLSVYAGANGAVGEPVAENDDFEGSFDSFIEVALDAGVYTTFIGEFSYDAIDANRGFSEAKGDDVGVYDYRLTLTGDDISVRQVDAPSGLALLAGGVAAAALRRRRAAR